MSDHIKKIFEIIRKTGDHVILADLYGEEAYVVMSLTEYESFLQKATHPQNNSALPSSSCSVLEVEEGETDIWKSMKEGGSSSETWDLSRLSTEELEELERQYRTFVETKGEDEQKEKVKELNFSKEKDVGEESEEQFYLEPVE